MGEFTDAKPPFVLCKKMCAVSSPVSMNAHTAFFLFAAALGGQAVAAEPSPPWLSPSALVAAPDGRTLFVACAGSVLSVDLAARKVVQAIAMPAVPTGLVLAADGRTLFVTCAAPQSEVCVVDVARSRISARLPAGHTAMAPVLSPDGKTLFVCNRFNDDVSVIDLATQSELRRIPVRREPVAAAITPDGRHLLVANHLPAGRADADRVAAVVSVIDTALGRVVSDIPLPNGSGSLQDIRISPDGKFAVTTHLLARFHLPTMQLARGWVLANALTIISLDRMEPIHTVLLDAVDRGGANPWGAAWSADGRSLVVAHAGTHEISVIDFPALLGKLSKIAPSDTAGGDVADDLSVLGDARKRRPLPADDLGPRGAVVVGRRAYTANYFSDTLSEIDLDGPGAGTIPLGPRPLMSAARKGELYFNDARICFQGWLSCAGCHPGDARVDALNWDLLNDGSGNPKNTRSLLFTFQTPPAMSLGVRESAAGAVRAGIRHILFTVQPPEVADALDAYLLSLKPVASPHLVKGGLSEPARRGEKLFRSPETGCARCHSGQLFTNQESYDVGTLGQFDKPADVFDTPSLVELWRTAPYLHDGSAATITEVLTSANKNDRHGRTSHLTPDQIHDLTEYLLSL